MSTRLKILIVEDNKSDAVESVHILQRAGMKVDYTIINEITVVHKLLATQNWDVVFSDFQLSTFTVLDVFNEFKRIGNDVPFIVISRAIGEEAAVNIIKLGVNNYLLKGNLQKLPFVVQSELNDAESRREFAKAQDKLLKNNLALEASIKARDDFIFMASHELKTPLTSFKLRLQLLKKKSTDEHVINEVDFFIRQINYFHLLIENMLDATRIFSHLFEIHCWKTQLKKTIEQAIEYFSTYLAASKTKIELAIPETIQGEWDELRLLILFFNLVSNIVKFAPGSHVRISARKKGRFVRISFKDDGPGISLDQQAHVFNRYERAGVSLDQSGLGLGLYVSKHIVEAHHGTIELISSPGKGTEIIIDLPFKSS